MRIMKQSVGALVASLATTVSSLVTFSPGPSYSVGIPSSSTISSSSTGALYFQLSASTSYQWVGLGIGSQMAGATIFVMYADGKGNVTISARDGGGGHVEPTTDSTIQAGVTLLAGSGIVGSQMIANVKCTTCKLDSSSSSSSSPWIAAWNTGSAINSASLSYTIAQHNANNYRQFTFDLSKASISSDSSPFVSSSSSSTTSRSGTATGSSPSSTSSSSSDDGDSSSDNGSGSGTGGAVVVGSSSKVLAQYDKAHGIIMGTTVVLLFPLGAIFARLGASAWMHGAWQVLSLASLVAGLGVGVKLAQMRSYVGAPSPFPYYEVALGPAFGGNFPSPDSGFIRRNELFNNTHTIFGVVIVGLFLIQPVFGIIHHLQYKRNLSRTGVSHLHIWYGRVIMILAVVNGGLGLQLAANTKHGEIAYGVVAGVIGLVYILCAAFRRKSGSSMMRKDTVVNSTNGFSSVDERESQRRERSSRVDPRRTRARV